MQPKILLRFMYIPRANSMIKINWMALTLLYLQWNAYYQWTESCSVLSNSFVTPWTVTPQAPLSMKFSRQEYWCELPVPSPGDLPGPGTEPRSPTLQADSLLFEPPGKPSTETKWLGPATAKSLQSCLTLCDPIDSSPPGSAIPGILQARTLEWVAISFSNAWKGKVKVKSVSCVWLFVTPWTAAHQPPPSMGFSRQEYWSGWPLPSPWLGPNHFYLSVPFSRSVMSSSLPPHGLHHARLPIHHQLPEPTQTPVHRVSDAIQPPHPLLSPSPPAFHLSQLFSNESILCIRCPCIGVSASTSVLPMNIQDWFPLGWTGWLSLLSKGLSRVFSNTTVQKHQFFGAKLSLWSNSHIHTWLLEKP